ncbi:MAG: glycosyltransferase family 4 protein [Blastocatellales bacterium]
MRPLYDGYIYYIQRNGGINRYFNRLIDHLPEDVEPALSLPPVCDSALPSNPRLSLRRYSPFRPERISKRIAPWYYTLAPLLGRADVIHPTYYATFARDHFRALSIPLVVTIHDMTHEIFPELADPDGFHAEQKRRSIEAASAIICVSENTRRDLLERYPEVEPIVTVIPLAADLTPADANPAVEPSGFLFVGSRAPYKNFDGALKALAKAVTADSDINMIVVGPAPDDRELKLISDLGLNGNVRFVGWIDDAGLRDLYAGSLALIYPSLYEGFGLPPLEAMTAGTVAVVSNSSSLPEVVGDAGILFDPTKIDDLAEIMIGLQTGRIDRAPWIARGAARSQAFSWETTARMTLDVYRSASARK